MQSSTWTSWLEPTSSGRKSRDRHSCGSSIGSWDYSTTPGHNGRGAASLRSRGRRVHRRKRRRGGRPFAKADQEGSQRKVVCLSPRLTPLKRTKAFKIRNQFSLTLIE